MGGCRRDSDRGGNTRKNSSCHGGTRNSVCLSVRVFSRFDRQATSFKTVFVCVRTDGRCGCTVSFPLLLLTPSHSSLSLSRCSFVLRPSSLQISPRSKKNYNGGRDDPVPGSSSSSETTTTTTTSITSTTSIDSQDRRQVCLLSMIILLGFTFGLRSVSDYPPEEILYLP